MSTPSLGTFTRKWSWSTRTLPADRREQSISSAFEATKLQNEWLRRTALKVS